MARRVDLPQPDGPEMEMYSPRWMSRSMPSRAWVSTSSVTNTFLTACMWIRGSGIGLSCKPAGGQDRQRYLIQSNARILILAGHSGEDNLIAWLQAVQNFRVVHGCMAQAHDRSRGFFALRLQFEQTYRTVGLPHD